MKPVKRLLGLALLVLAPLAIAAGGRRPPGVCSGARTAALTPAEFRAVLERVARGWNEGRPETALACFTESAVYLEPPDRQLYRGHPALREFFAGSVQPARPDRMRWHAAAFDSARQAGFGEYTYRGRQNYHGVVVVRLQDGLIRSWREYQYGSPLSWEEFVGPSR